MRGLFEASHIASLLVFSWIFAGMAFSDEVPKGLSVAQREELMAKVEAFHGLGKHALIIGINEYENRDQGIPALNFAVGDANAVFQVLTDPEGCGFPDSTVSLITDDGPVDPTSANIGRALNTLASRCGPDDLVIVFFSGHGFEDNGRAYLLPSNADLEALDYTAIERDAFIRQVDRISSEKVVVILDACHSGGISRGGKGVGRDAALSAQYYQQFMESRGRAYIASCSGGELSWEDKEVGHGVFTASLVRGLGGKADSPPQDGLITLFELRRFLEEDVSAWAKENGKSQQPQINLEATFGDIPLGMNKEYISQQEQYTQERFEEARYLRAELANMDELDQAELSRALGVVEKYRIGEPLLEDEEQELQFIRKLADGSIDVSLFRAGVSSGLPADQTGEEPQAPAGIQFAFWGQAQSFQANKVDDAYYNSPGLFIGYGRKKFGFGLGYEYCPGKFITRVGTKIDFDAHLATLEAIGRFPLSGPVMGSLGLGVGGFFGSDIRNDKFNWAVKAHLGVNVGVSRKIHLLFFASYLFSNAQSIHPAEQELKNRIAFGLGISIF